MDANVFREMNASHLSRRARSRNIKGLLQINLDVIQIFGTFNFGAQNGQM